MTWHVYFRPKRNSAGIRDPISVVPHLAHARYVVAKDAPAQALVDAVALCLGAGTPAMRSGTRPKLVLPSERAEKA